MSVETERKFLVTGEYKSLSISAQRIAQGYLTREAERSVRVRIKGSRGYLTIKGPSYAAGTSRYEWEQEIPCPDAEDLLRLCLPGIIDKTRYYVPWGIHTFEVDEFHRDNQGLTIAEIELSDPDEAFDHPEWLGKEVTGDDRYYNASLSRHPFKEWR